MEAYSPFVTFETHEWQEAFAQRQSGRLERAAPQDILAWALDSFGPGLAISTAFGASGMALIDMALRLDASVDIFYIDTGYFFAETLGLIEAAEQRYGRSFRRVLPDLTIVEQNHEYGPGLYNRNPSICCHLRKVQPLAKALRNKLAWMAALRRDQSRSRAATPVVRWNATHQVLKISPLARWQEEDVWAYIDEHGLPYNTLHDRGFPSIGCWPCTQPVQPGDDPRAGRWAGLAKTECGLHQGLGEQT